MAKELTESSIMRSIVLNKVARGKFINVRRTVRDLEYIDDYEASQETGESTTDLLKKLVAKKDSKEVASANVLSDIMSKLDAIESKQKDIEDVICLDTNE